jgi:uncharacterized protein (TIGR02594 family)
MSLEPLVRGGPLALGSQGAAVKALQLALASHGFKLKGTGYFGGATDTAVQAFQKAQGLKADGEVGVLTARALDDAAVSGKIVVAPEVAGRPLWLTEAMKWVGTHEGVGAADNPTLIEWAHEEGGAIAKSFTHDSIPWCSLFANMVLTKVGLKGTETLWALDWAGKWPSTRLVGPAVGAFAPMKREGGGHIMIVVGRDKAGNVVGVGGNQSDAVNLRSFPLARLNQGFWWPTQGVSPPARVGSAALPIVRSDGSSVREG